MFYQFRTKTVFAYNYFNCKQLIRFFITGVTATITHLGVLITLVELGGYGSTFASGTGFVLAVIVSYFLNYHWTFGATENHFKHLSKYLIVCLTGLIINTAILFTTVSLLDWWYIIGQLLAMFITVPASFVFNRHWVFPTN